MTDVNKIPPSLQQQGNCYLTQRKRNLKKLRQTKKTGS